ncbi:MAG: hypothetical protein HVN34_08370 [Methanobacteriaceae archaeon]|nr:hypothetical protein [Methanobacteriaceae archaeon]
MVIAKPEWFKKNKGILSLGVTWQGTVYLLATVSLIFIGMMLPQNVIITVTISALFLFLFFDAMYASLKSMDERAKLHYSIAMRNTAWGMIVTIVMVSLVMLNFNDEVNLGVLIIATGLVGFIVNVATRYKLEKSN